MPPKYREAFALMWYQCSCGARIRAWNSRDGKVLRSVTCSSCGGAMRNVDTHLDERKERHLPFPGQLVFRDRTLGEAQLMTRKRLLLTNPAGLDNPAMLRDLTALYYGRGDEPTATYFSEDAERRRLAMLISLNSMVDADVPDSTLEVMTLEELRDLLANVEEE